MVAGGIKYEVDPNVKFRKALTEAAIQVQDLTIPLTLIARNWFKSNQAIFALKGPGKYPDLSPKYKKRKERHAPLGPYPILVWSGQLAGSITDPTNPDAVDYILNKNVLFVGTKIPWGVFHQSLAPRKKIPFRPFLFIGAEQTAPPELNKRQDAWIKILHNFVNQKLSPLGSVNGSA